MAAAAEIAAIRRFNRFYTRRIGVLDEGLLDSGYTLAEVRVLYEIAQRRSVTAIELGRDLQIDRGYLSRMLRQFEGRRLVSRRRSAADSRRRELALTPAGERLFADLDRRARRAVGAMTRPLDSERRRALLDAMRVIETALDAPAPAQAAIRLRAHRPGDIGWVVQRHGEVYAHEYGWDEQFEALVAQIAADFLRHFDSGRERCWIAERAGGRVGCVFVTQSTRATAKLRLLLVEPVARGSGLGRRLVDECIAFARAAGYRRLVLWTQSNLAAARAIYAASGFVLAATEAHHSFGHALVAETWKLEL